MKTTLKFETEDTDDIYQIKAAIKASDLVLCLWDMDQELRSQIKYQNKEHLQEARDMLWELMDQYGISFDDLTY